MHGRSEVENNIFCYSMDILLDFGVSPHFRKDTNQQLGITHLGITQISYNAVDRASLFFYYQRRGGVNVEITSYS